MSILPLVKNWSHLLAEKWSHLLITQWNHLYIEKWMHLFMEKWSKRVKLKLIPQNNEIKSGWCVSF